MKNLKKLTILHSNDMHGDFLAEQIDEKLVGGVSLLSGYVSRVRREEPNVLYAIAGDMFRGSIIDSEYRGASTIGIMNLLGPDVATIGNHEVDYGLAHLLFLEKCANFPIINANFHIKSNHKRLFQPHHIAHIDGMKVLFIGGHSHTFLTEPAKVNDIYIVQAGTGTDQIGRFDIMVDTDRNAIDTFTWQLIPIDDAHCPRDEEMENFILHYQQATSEKYERIITRFADRLTHPARNQETALGDLIADIMRDSLGIDLMLMGSGAIRSEAMGPVVHYADLVECLPYDDAVYLLRVTGAQLERMLRHILRDEAFQGDHTEFYQFSHGLRIVWERSAQQFRELTLDGEPLHADRLYSVAMQKYHYSNLKPFLNITLEEAEENGKSRVLATSLRDVVEEYLSTHPHLSRQVEGRLVVEP